MTMKAGFHSCLGEGCTKTITWKFALCASCEIKYGRHPSGWPKWLSYLWKDTLRERRQIERVRRHEVSVDPDEILEVRDGPKPIE